MKTCVNHPQKEAFSSCHNCSRDYCSECLDEGSAYYYCRLPQCHEALQKEIMPAQISCLSCNTRLELSFAERKKKKIHCPQCEAFLDFTAEPPQVFAKENYVLLLSSLNQGDIAVIKSILDKQVDFYMSGENFLTVEPLIQPARFYVNINDVQLARELLKDFHLNPWGAG